MDLLKLIVVDSDDLEIVSAHLQDAIVKVSDIHWRPKERRFVVGACRFDWESALQEAPAYRRRLAALRFDRVLSCKCRNVAPHDPKAVLNLLAVEFNETNAPAGTATLVFSGGSAIRLELECLEAELTDLGPVWTANKCPDHPVEAAALGVDAPPTPRH